LNAHNSFSSPNVVAPNKFSDAVLSNNHLDIALPPMSVVMLELEGTCELPAALDIKDPQPGIKYNYFEGSWSTLPSFDSLTVIRTGTLGQFIIPEKNSGENFAVQYDGYLKIPEDGVYTFYLNSDDGALLFIDGALIVDNDGRHAPQEESGAVVLKSGYHQIKAGFFQASGGKSLDVSIESRILQKQIIPSTMLFH
jgi:hypothetical protein